MHPIKQGLQHAQVAKFELFHARVGTNFQSPGALEENTLAAMSPFIARGSQLIAAVAR